MSTKRERQKRLDASIDALALMKDGWSLLACSNPSVFINDVATELREARAEVERLRSAMLGVRGYIPHPDAAMTDKARAIREFHRAMKGKADEQG